ncbi:response regulator transcription factor [Arcicella sp. LKC2W]|uniref:response regulator transcription factor n=1 Tax=Arcicella sp. LKC2W TaxID=2984198 RepID=UPI002B1F3811|nr:response regulator transcription factor [Arcicella sp. LKC2W]MEA5460835.1 response regulator transcription factor [Arcicella sp. LKC2W]
MKTKVIIIDDHALFNEGMRLILKESGFFEVVEQVYDSRQAQIKCFSLKADLIIVDYNMPYLNGLEVVRQLNAWDSDTKIVIVIMYADKKEIELFKKEGVDAYITKTTPAIQLIETLKKVMKGEKIFAFQNNVKAISENDSFANKHQFTKREMEILRLIKQEETTEKIANMLNISFYNVETHRKNINHKLKFKSKKEFYDFLDTIEE